MMMIPGNDYQIDAQFKSPMGWVKARVAMTLLSDTSFSGCATLVGTAVELKECEKSGSHFHFTASPNLPFGVFQVEVDADISEDGKLTGIANAPRHKPMEIKGQVKDLSAAAQ